MDDNENKKNYLDEKYRSIASQLELIFPLFVLYIIGMVIFYLFNTNRELFELDKDILIILRKGINTIYLLLVPFIIGVIGAFTRVLLNGEKVFHMLKIIIGSGFMSGFSWIGIKSGVFLKTISSHLNTVNPDGTNDISNGSVVNTNVDSDFYTLVLVAFAVGMFSTNLYLFVQERVDKAIKKHNNDSDK